MSEELNSKVYVLVVEKSIEGIFLDYDDALDALEGRKGKIMVVVQSYSYNEKVEPSS